MSVKYGSIPTNDTDFLIENAKEVDTEIDLR